MFRRCNFDFGIEGTRLDHSGPSQRVDFDIAHLLGGKNDSTLHGGASPGESRTCTPGHYRYSARGREPKCSLYILCRGGTHDSDRSTGIGVISPVPTIIINGRRISDNFVVAKSINKFLKLGCFRRGYLCQYRAFLRESRLVTYITYLNRIMGALRNEASVTLSDWVVGQILVRARVSFHKAGASLGFCQVVEMFPILFLAGQEV